MNVNSIAPLSSANLVKKWGWIFLWLLCITKIGAYIWSLDKGIDFSDDGFYLMSYRYPFEDKFSFGEFHTVKHFFFSWVQSIFGLRMLRVVLDLLCGSILLTSFVTFFRGNGLHIRYSTVLKWGFPILIFGFFLSNANRTMSYNELVGYFSSLWLSCLLLAASDYNNVPLQTHLYKTCYFIAGMCMACLFFVKFPTILLTSILTFVFFLAMRRKHKLYISIALFVCGFFTFSAIFISYMGGISQYVARWTQGYTLYHDVLGYKPARMIGTYFGDLLEVLKRIGVPLLLAIFYIFKSKKNYPVLFGAATILSFYGSVLIFNDGIALDEHEDTLFGNYMFYLVHFVSFQAIIIGVLYTKEISRKNFLRHYFVWIIFLLPILNALGTYGTITDIINNYTVPWFVLIFFGLIYFPSERKLLLTVTSGTLISSLFIFTFFWFYPEKVNIDIMAQNRPISVHGETVMLDTETKQFVTTIRNELSQKGFETENNLVVISDAPGLAYMLEAKSPYTYWFRPQQFGDFTCFYLDQPSAQKDLKTMFFLFDEVPEYDQFNCKNISAKSLASTHTRVNLTFNFDSFPKNITLFCPKDE